MRRFFERKKTPAKAAEAPDVPRLTLPSDYPWPEVPTVLSERDEMISGADHAHYLAVGVSAMQNIHAALQMRRSYSPSSILDMPCGHGRVTRVFRALFPEADISVCDLDEDAVAFSAEQFNATPLRSSPDFTSLDFGRTYDLVWTGSLITHLPAKATADFFAFVVRHLSDDGVAVVSSHGPFVAGRIQASVYRGGEGYGTKNAAAKQMITDYFDHGFGYADYPQIREGDQHYGVSLATREWITDTIERAGGRILFYRDHSWDRHHDIAAFQKRP